MWTSTFSSSDGEPSPEDIRMWSAPENEIPVALPLNTVLARTDDVAVALLHLSVYTTGIALELVVRMRPEVATARNQDMNGLLWEDGPGGGRFLLGVELADGRRATGLGPPGSSGVVFPQGGGSGGQASVQQSWWLHPLPPAGPLRFVVRSPELGIEETSVVLDGAAIRRAADDVLVLWPWAPPPEQARSEPTGPPDLPADSWFAQT
jgi:hypothetical protein